ncbi:MAG TPA: SURF1 family protein [Propionibacteriaceae bacterium]|jgi:cytochrome oxidase assembly protein ShyY1|nr:SURF1 family protein [Propionibacteriaceae bacterium]
MTRLKQVLVIALGIAVAAAMVAMGYWQLEVYHNQGREAAERRASAPPVPLSSVARAGAPVKDGYGRSVTLEGSYDPALQLLVPVEDRTDQFRVLSGLRQPDGSLVAVVRGVVFESAAAPPPPTGLVHEVGVLLPSEEHVPETDLSSGQIASVRLPALAQQWPGPLIDGFVTLSSADAARQGLAPAEWRLPEARGRLRNGAYAMQWWLFAAFTLFMASRIARDLGREPEENLGGSEATSSPSGEL